ncbi:MAG: ferritin family protein [candidate division WOR-3 bacterium]|nr:ferritin family protein [candidate division WOR-3 bacterium]
MKKKKTTTRKVPSINRLLNAALIAEKKAQDFYTDASGKAQSEAGKKLFMELAAFEARHYEYVKSIIEARKGKTIIDSSSFVKASKDIKPEVSGEFEPNKDEIIDVLNIGIKAEKMAMSRYLKIAKSLKDKESKKIFEQLAEDEKRHQAILEAEVYNLANKGTIVWGE